MLCCCFCSQVLMGSMYRCFVGSNQKRSFLVPPLSVTVQNWEWVPDEMIPVRTMSYHFGVKYKNINNYNVTYARSCNNNKKSFVLIPYFFLLWISTTFNFIAPFTATLLLALFIINSNKRLLPPPVTIITITPPRCPLIHLHQRKWITPQQRIEQSVVVSIKEGIEDKKPLE